MIQVQLKKKAHTRRNRRLNQDKIKRRIKQDMWEKRRKNQDGTLFDVRITWKMCAYMIQVAGNY